jgi:hypothetical protein
MVMIGAAALATALDQVRSDSQMDTEAWHVVSALYEGILPIPENDACLTLLQDAVKALHIESLPAHLCALEVLKAARQLIYGVRSPLFDGFTMPGLIGDEGEDYSAWLTKHELGGENGKWARWLDCQHALRERFEKPDLQKFSVTPVLRRLTEELHQPQSRIRNRLIGAGLVRPYPSMLLPRY